MIGAALDQHIAGFRTRFAFIQDSPNLTSRKIAQSTEAGRCIRIFECPVSDAGSPIARNLVLWSNLSRYVERAYALVPQSHPQQVAQSRAPLHRVSVAATGHISHRVAKVPHPPVVRARMSKEPSLRGQLLLRRRRNPSQVSVRQVLPLELFAELSKNCSAASKTARITVRTSHLGFLYCNPRRT